MRTKINLRFLYVLIFFIMFHLRVLSQSTGILYSYNTQPYGTWTANAGTTIIGSGADDVLTSFTPPAGTGTGQWNGFYFGGVYFPAGQPIYVSSNGFLSFNNPVSSLPNNSLSSNSFAIIAPLWDDLMVGPTGDVNWRIIGGSPSRRLVIEWNGMLWDKNATVVSQSFQVTIYERTHLTSPNAIQFKYDNHGFTGSSGIDISSGGASIGLAGFCNNDFYSWLISPGTSSPIKTSENVSISSHPSLSFSYRLLPTAHPNDDCAAAQALTFIPSLPLISSIGTTLHSSQSAISLPSCVGLLTTSDVWYTFTKPANLTTFEIYTENLDCRGANYQTGIQVFDSCGGSEIGCDFGSSGPTGTNASSYLYLTSQPCSAVQYWVRVFSVDTAYEGYFRFNIRPPGRNCSYPTDITNCSFPYQSPVNLSTCGFGNDLINPNMSCSSQQCGGDDYVFYYLPNSNQGINLHLNNTPINSHPHIFIYQGCPGTGNCMNYTSGVGGISLLVSNVSLLANQPYYFIVDYDSSGGVSCLNNFDLTIDLLPTSPPLFGQDCSLPFNICTNSSFNVTDGARYGNGNVMDLGNTGTCISSGETGSSWYNFSVTGPAAFQFQITPNNSSEIDFMLYVIDTVWNNYQYHVFPTVSNYCSQLDNPSAFPCYICNYVTSTSNTGCNTSAGTIAIPGSVAASATTTSPAISIPNGMTATFLLLVNNRNNTGDGFNLNWFGSLINGNPPNMTWVGATSTSWTDRTNWSPDNCGNIPDCANQIAAIILPGNNQPIISSNITVKNITITQGATLTINSGVTLSVCGDFTNNGTLICQSGSTVNFIGNLTENINGTFGAANSFDNLSFNKVPNSEIHLNTNILVSGDLNIAAGSVCTLLDNSVHTVSGNFSATGTSSSPITIQSSITATILKSGGTVCSDWLILNNIQAFGGASFYAGDNSLLQGTTSGWLNQSCQGASPVYTINFYSKVNGNVSLGWEKQIAQGNSSMGSPPPVKICADGSKSTILKLTCSNLNYDMSKFRFRILNGVDPIYSGSFGLFQASTALISIDTFQHPMIMDWVQPFKPLTIEVYNIDSPGTNIFTYPIELYRAPVLFVHGLWGNKTTFQDMASRFITDNLFPFLSPLSEGSPLLYRIDYENSNDFSFGYNSQQVPLGINKLLFNTRSENYSAGRVDVICHSMGGVLTRLYVEELYGNVYRTDIHKFITLNTPHSGSQLANFLWFHPTTYCERVTHHNTGRNECNSAIENLRVTSSDFLNYLNNPVYLSKLFALPTYAFLSDGIGTSSCGGLNFLEGLLLSFDNHGVSQLFNGENNDLIVALSSQQGNIDKNDILHNHCHTDIANDVSMQTMVINVLNAVPDASNFDMDGFTPPDLSSISIYPSPPLENSQSLSFIHFISPVYGTSFSSDTTITLEISASGDVDSILILLRGQTFSKIIDTVMSGYLSVAISLPVEEIGKFDFTVLASDSSHSLLADTTAIHLYPNAILNSIHVEPSVGYIAVNEKSPFQVWGYYNDSIKRKISELQGVVYSIFDTSKAQSISQNLIEGVSPGSTYLGVSYQGYFDTIPVEIYLGESWLSTSIHENYLHNVNSSAASENYPLLQIFPNPTSENLTLAAVAVDLGFVEISIQDILGKIRFIQKFENYSSSVIRKINVSGFAKGMYVVSLIDKRKRYIQKLVVD